MEFYPKSNLETNENFFQTLFLISIFIKYYWDERDGQPTDNEHVQLVKWMESVNINVNDFWRSSDVLRLRNRPRIQLTEEIKSNEHLLRQAEETNREIKYSQLVFNMRRVLPFLINGKGNVNYIDRCNRTLFYAFVEELSLMGSQTLSQEHLSRVQSVVKKLIAKGASLYASAGTRFSTVLRAAHCKNKAILETIVACSLPDLSQAEHRTVVTSILEVAHNNTIPPHIVPTIKNRKSIEMMVSCLNLHTDNATALHQVVNNFNYKYQAVYTDIVRVLVCNGADINYKNFNDHSNGRTALHLAAEKFLIGVLKIFANNGGDFQECIYGGQTALHLACKSPLLKFSQKSDVIEQTIDFLIDRCDHEIYDANENMPLHYAAQFGCAGIIDKFIEKGVNVNARTETTGMTALHLAVKNPRLDVMDKLVEAGVDVNVEAADGTTPLFVSVLSGSYESMLYLIGQGADLYRRDTIRGFTLLHLAALAPEASGEQNEEGEEKDKFHYLLKQDYNIDDPGYCGVTPLLLATLTSKINVVRELIERGADVNYQKDNMEMTALHLASMTKNLDIVKLLLEAGANVNCRAGIEQWTPLHLLLAKNIKWRLGTLSTSCLKASILSHEMPKFKDKLSNLDSDKILITLIENGAEVNVKDANGRSPLHLAMQQTKFYYTRILLDAGARPNVKDNEDRTPLSIAVDNNLICSFQELLHFGADINDVDISQQLIKCKNALKRIATMHMLKLKLYGLPVAPFYNSPSITAEGSSFYNNATEEIMLTMCYKLDNNIWLRDFLHMKPKRQYQFVEGLKSNYAALQKVFPLYFGIIHAACCEASQRKSLLESAKIAWMEVTNIYLPDICLDYVFSFLSNSQLDTFVENSKLIEQILLDESTEAAFHGCLKNESRLTVRIP